MGKHEKKTQNKQQWESENKSHAHTKQKTTKQKNTQKMKKQKLKLNV